MAVYVISDLHLSYGVNKPMDVFGDKWKDYEEKIKKDWLAKITSKDWVIIAGDLSWATYLEESIRDFEFINNLPGKKIILKGNHDYWWETVTKMNNFLEEHGVNNIFFLYNNCIETEESIICGTRYWDSEEGKDNDKIFNREIERAKFSLKEAYKINEKYAGEGKIKKKIIMVTHYPPDIMLINALKNFEINIWIYGHIHSNYEESKISIEGVETYLTSCDYLDFKLMKLT